MCKSLSAADEIIDIDDNIVIANMKQVVKKILEGDTLTWTAICLLEDNAMKIKGFAFSIKRDSKGLPCAIMYMTPRMRHDAIRFGDVIFLDAQQRQFNSSGFPYISPCMFDDEGRVAQGCEFIVIKESINMYAWILKEMNRLEPCFKLKTIRYIFLDQKVTNTLLQQLGIIDTCTL